MVRIIVNPSVNYIESFLLCSEIQRLYFCIVIVFIGIYKIIFNFKTFSVKNSIGNFQYHFRIQVFERFDQITV